MVVVLMGLLVTGALSVMGLLVTGALSVHNSKYSGIE
jgi:hypothetical protein